MTFEEWLAQQGPGRRAPALVPGLLLPRRLRRRQARAYRPGPGIHYFASRHGFHARARPRCQTREGVLTWPEGNGWLTQRLAAPLADARLHTGASVLRMPSPPRRGGGRAGRRQRPGRRWQARRCIVALPLFVAARLVQPLPDFCDRGRAAPAMGAWLVANIHLDRPLPDRRGAARPGRTCSHQDATPGGLGYVDAGHQRLDARAAQAAPTVLTYYQALGDLPPVAGAAGAALDALADAIVATLAGPRPDIHERAQRMELTRYGHAMAIPVPGLQGFLHAKLASHYLVSATSYQMGSVLPAPPTPATARLAFADADWSRLLGVRGGLHARACGRGAGCGIGGWYRAPQYAVAQTRLRPGRLAT